MLLYIATVATVETTLLYTKQTTLLTVIRVIVLYYIECNDAVVATPVQLL